MNDANISESKHLVFRRLSDPFYFFGREYPSTVWLFVLAAVLLLAFFYVAWMYRKDSQGVGLGWAIFLGILRSLVYMILAIVFLLPGWQTSEDVVTQSKVLILFDVSTSLETRDDLPEEGKSFNQLPTRQDKVLRLLENKGMGFLNGLTAKNPVGIYRFGSRLDDNFLYYDSGRVYDRQEMEDIARDPSLLNQENRPRVGFTMALLGTWLRPGSKADPAQLKELEGLGSRLPSGDIQLDDKTLSLLNQYSGEEIKNGKALDGKALSDLRAAITRAVEVDKDRIARLGELNTKLVDGGFLNGTNVLDTTNEILTRELARKVQGIIVVTDGRNTTPSLTQLDEIRERSKKNKIPIFVVGVGVDRPQVRIDFSDIRAPRNMRPEDSFRLQVDVIGEGLADQEANIDLEVTRVKRNKDGKEELREIKLVETDGKGGKVKADMPLTLGTKLILKPVSPVKFDRSLPPRAVAEFQIDAASLARAAGIDLNADANRGKKWEIAETSGDGDKEGEEFQFVARVPRDKLEIYPNPIHLSDKVQLQVLRKPVQALLFASGATREYQFLRTLLVREMEKDRVMVSIHIQNPPGITERREGIQQDVPPKRLLDIFPDKFDQPADTEDDKLRDLASYDVIVAFDPDWNALTDKQLENVQKWVERGGGLVVLGGPINTLQLARPGASKEKLKPILDLYPVVLKDSRIEELDRKPDRPWPLAFDGATQEMDFLKLSDDVDSGSQPFLSDWQNFFGKNPDGSTDASGNGRGFFNYYPVEQEKTGQIVVARFVDPVAKDKNGKQMPFIVTTPEGAGRRVIWLGSGELWRLRMFKESYHERFWTKLLRWAGSANQGKTNKRITAFLNTVYKAGKFVDFEARIDGKGGEPLGPKSRQPEFTLKLPLGVNPKEIPTDYPMKAKPGSLGTFTGKFQIKSPGTYEMELRSPETSDVVTQKFTVTPSNPELDDTKPDFELMGALASDTELVLARMSDGEAKELTRRLSKPRLYFDLANADLIPTCMRQDIERTERRGPVADQWDEGFILWGTKFSYVLFGVVGLLCIEWLTRKLLRLA